jgi:putative nucleotidyltransferase with HDIG domain
VLFNLSAPAVAIWVSTNVFFIVAGIEPLHQSPRPILSLLVPLIAMAVVYFLLNSWLIAAAVGFEKHISALLVWRQNFLWLSLNFFSGASMAALLLPYLQDPEQSFFRVAGILLPLLLISYLTYKTALGRVDDANRHLNELNQLYLSTIETLAMAIDAKDQITHGHIRRVQQYAVGLAKRVGITDPGQISAIEAASLLHDMGKLAVPEYILNKPGKLTPAEFDRMKMHASVGADILSAIKFPYPVVPIVRHHHESWDGTGYPDGLKGDAIPIGARILSVVDCFDALTSDRPYRPRLSDSDAVRILLQRRGSMYDPVIVDAFIASLHELAAVDAREEARKSERFTRALIEQPQSTAARPLENIAASSEEMLLLYEVAKALTGVRPDQAIQIVYTHLRRIVPISACVFYRYNPATDGLVATLAAGENAGTFLGIHISRGQRLSGWVAANKQTILNSDPVLDLGEIARMTRPRLKSCLSTPVLVSDSLVGVLTIYSVHDEAFAEDHRRIFESVSRQVGDTLRSAPDSGGIDMPAVSGSSPAKQLPSDKELAAFFDRVARHGPIAIIYVHILSDTSIAVTNDALALRVACDARLHLPDSTLFFRHSGTELLAALPGVELSLALRIGMQLGKHFGNVESEAPIRLTIGVSSSPEDGSTLSELVAAAKGRQLPLDPQFRRLPAVH